MMQTFFDARQLAHAPARELTDGDWAPHAETPARAADVAARLPVSPVRDFGVEPLLAVHTAPYLDFLRRAHADWRARGRQGDALGYAFPVVGRRPLRFDRLDADLGAFSFDAVTPVTAGTWESAYWGAQGALSALAAVAAGPARHAFALCRPPGHHAGADYMGGYCYLNNAAIVAAAARAQGLGPVAILDVDYHHGNGTQDIFYRDPGIFFCSIHADPQTDYPYFWGHADETGEGPGAGTTLNLPLARGATAGVYAEALAAANHAIAAWGARLLVVSFGADTYAEDPISHFALRQADFDAMGRQIAALGLPTVIVMEGGYAVAALGRNVEAFLAGFGA